MGSVSAPTKKRRAIFSTFILVLTGTALLSMLIHPVAGFGLGLILATQSLFVLELYCAHLDAEARKPRMRRGKAERDEVR